MLICHAKQKFLKSAPVKCVGMNSEFTFAPRNVMQEKASIQEEAASRYPLDMRDVQVPRLSDLSCRWSATAPKGVLEGSKHHVLRRCY
jgi:hypothetical protein